jgi:hypothetical protein
MLRVVVIARHLRSHYLSSAAAAIPLVTSKAQQWRWITNGKPVGKAGVTVVGPPVGALGVHDYGGQTTGADSSLLHIDLSEREYTPLERKVWLWSNARRESVCDRREIERREETGPDREIC